MQVNLHVTDKAAAKTLLAQRIVAAEKDDAGLADTLKDHRSRPLAEHVGDWHGVLIAQG